MQQHFDDQDGILKQYSCNISIFVAMTTIKSMLDSIFV